MIRGFAGSIIGFASVIGIAGCAVEGVTQDREIGSMQIQSRIYGPGFSDRVDVYEERGTGRHYYYYNGVKEYMDQGPGVDRGPRSAPDR